jgi:DNA polymerase III subunit beta
MELTIEQPRLLAALNLAQSVADNRTTMPILGHVLLSASEGLMNVSATDLVVGATETMPVDIKSPGSVALDARRIRDIVKTLPTCPLTIRALDNGWVQITAGKSTFKVMGIAGCDYPRLPECKDTGCAVKASALTDMIAHTLYSVSTDNSRVNLAGALLECDGETATMVSTDGHRLTRVSLPFTGPKLPAGIVIPRKGLVELSRAFNRFDGTTVKLAVTKDYLFATADALTLAIKLSHVTFPPYKAVIPTSHTRTATVCRTDIVDALRRCAVMASYKTSMVRMDVGEDSLQLVADNPESGTAHQTVDADCTGDTLAIGLNAAYLLQAIEVLDCDDVRLEFSGELDPVVVRPDESLDYTAVVMPMRV